jgi:hypothetical protein
MPYGKPTLNLRFTLLIGRYRNVGIRWACPCTFNSLEHKNTRNAARGRSGNPLLIFRHNYPVVHFSLNSELAALVKIAALPFSIRSSSRSPSLHNRSCPNSVSHPVKFWLSRCQTSRVACVFVWIGFSPADSHKTPAIVGVEVTGLPGGRSLRPISVQTAQVL